MYIGNIQMSIAKLHINIQNNIFINQNRDFE